MLTWDPCIHRMLAVFFAVHAGAAILAWFLGFWCQLATCGWCGCVAAYIVTLRREWQREFQFRFRRSDRGCPSNLREPALHPKSRLARTLREAKKKEVLEASNPVTRLRHRAVAMWRTVSDQQRRQGPDALKDPPKLRSFSTFATRPQFRASSTERDVSSQSDTDSCDDATDDDCRPLVDCLQQPINLATSSIAESGPPACPFNNTVAEAVKAFAEGSSDFSKRGKSTAKKKQQQAWGSEFIHRPRSSSSTTPPSGSGRRAGSMVPLGAARSHKLDMK